VNARFSDRRVLILSALGGFMLAVSGCQSGDSKGVLGSAAEPAGTAQPAPGKVAEADLRAYCPRVTLRDGTTFFNTYAKGAKDDPTKVIYQASISDATRSCRTVDGNMTIDVAIGGRVVPGPAFAPGNVNLPIRVVVSRGDEVLYTNLGQQQVAVQDPSAAAQFVYRDSNVSFTLPPDQRVTVFVGFDEGGAKDQKKKKK
jgi:hypothetical protein